MPALLSGAAATIAVVIPTAFGKSNQSTDPFFQELIGGITDAARKEDCDVLISHLSPTSLDDLGSLMTANRADGVILIGQNSLHEQLNRLAETETRFIVWGAELPDQKYCCIGSDNFGGGRRATSHLLNLGRRNIAFLGDRGSPEVFQRYEGYVAAHERIGLPYNEDLRIRTNFEVESGEAALDALLDNGLEFDAVFAASDVAGLGAIRALRRAGKRIPEDVAIVGYDNLQLSTYSNPALTTISQDMVKAGRLMVSKLIAAIDGAQMRSERLATELIVRESCGMA